MSAQTSSMHIAITSTDHTGNARRNAKCPMATSTARATPAARAHVLSARMPQPMAIYAMPRISQIHPQAVKLKTSRS